MVRRRERGWQGYDSERYDDGETQKNSDFDPGYFGVV